MARGNLEARYDQDQSGYGYICARGPMTLQELRHALPAAWTEHSFGNDRVYNIERAVEEELAPSSRVLSLFHDGGVATQQGRIAQRPFHDVVADMPTMWQEELHTYGVITRRLGDCEAAGVRVGLSNAGEREYAIFIDPNFITSINYHLSRGGGVMFGYSAERTQEIIAYERAHKTRRVDDDFVALPINLELLAGRVITDGRPARRSHPYLPVSDAALGRATLLGMVAERQ